MKIHSISSKLEKLPQAIFGNERVISSKHLFLLSVPIFLLISYGSEHHWDEYHYLYSVLNHSPSKLLELEKGLSDAIFIKHFFSVKIAFLFLLRFLVQVFGSGFSSIYIIQFLFTALLVAYIFINFRLFGEILERDEAFDTTVVLIFSPILIYLGYKILSEVPSLLLTTVACFSFMKSLKVSKTPLHGKYVMFSIISLAAGVLFRLSSIIMFGGLIVALFFLKDNRYKPKKIVTNSIIIVISSLFIVIAFLALVELPIERFFGITSGILKRGSSLGLKVYSFLTSVQFFLPVLVVSLFRPWNRKVVFAFIWTTLCILPFMSGYVETRYLYLAITPFAVLIYHGLQRLSVYLHFLRGRLGWAFLLVVFVFGNIWFFKPIMPFEIDQNQYSKMMKELKSRYPDATYVIPWLTDYCFLRFAFPEYPIKFSFSEANHGMNEVFRSPEFHQWVGEANYVGDIEKLNSLTAPLIYVGWEFSLPVIRLESQLKALGIGFYKNVRERNKLRNHLAVSWVWYHPELKLTRISEIGPYQAFSISISPKKLTPKNF